MAPQRADVSAVVDEVAAAVRTGALDAGSSAAIARHAVKVAKRVHKHPEDVGAVADAALAELISAGVVSGSAAGVLQVLIDEGVVRELVHELHVAYGACRLRCLRPAAK